MNAGVGVSATRRVPVPVGHDQLPATLAWEEGGHIFEPTAGDDQTEVDVAQLVTMASALERIDQPDLAERFGDPFMRHQVDTVRSWFTATPLPPGWDPSPLIHHVAQTELQMSETVFHYLECAWLAEWRDAVHDGNEERRRTAEATLADRPNWPVLITRAKTNQQLPNSTDLIEAVAQRAATQRQEMPTISSPQAASDNEANYGCGFKTPR